MESGSIFAPDGASCHQQGQTGVRIVEGDGEVAWYQRYNPLATVPYATFKSLGEEPTPPPIRDVEHFHWCLAEAARSYHGSAVVSLAFYACSLLLRVWAGLYMCDERALRDLLLAAHARFVVSLQVKEKCEIVESTIKMEASFAGKVINDYNTEYKKTGELAIPRKPPTKS